MKVSVPIETTIATALAARYDIDKLQSDLDATYNDPAVMKVIEEKAGLKTATVRDKKNLFNSTHGIQFKMEAKLSDPLKTIAWLVNWSAFCKKNGTPNGVLSASDLLPPSIVFWLETNHLKPEFKAGVLGSNPNLQQTRESVGGGSGETAKEREIREGKEALEATRQQVSGKAGGRGTKPANDPVTS